MEGELIEYVACPVHDILMLQWFGAVTASGDIHNLFPERVSYTISRFFDHMQGRKSCFKVDAEGVWFVAIYTAEFAGAEFGMWVRPDKRKGKQWNEAMCEALEYGFAKWPVLYSLTSQENLLGESERMGYTVAGKVPGLWDGTKDVWIMYMTKTSFEARQMVVTRRAANDR